MGVQRLSSCNLSFIEIKIQNCVLALKKKKDKKGEKKKSPEVVCFFDLMVEIKGCSLLHPLRRHY